MQLFAYHISNKYKKSRSKQFTITALLKNIMQIASCSLHKCYQFCHG